MLMIVKTRNFSAPRCRKNRWEMRKEFVTISIMGPVASAVGWW